MNAILCNAGVKKNNQEKSIWYVFLFNMEKDNIVILLASVLCQFNVI